MKRTIQIITSTSAASILAFAALAQAPPNPKADQPDYTRDVTPRARQADRLNGAAKASDLIGMELKNKQNEKLGKVDDLAVDVESGRIVYVILSTGGFIGIGDTLHAVPPGALHHDVANKVIHLDADKEKLKAAPKFEMAKWAESSDSDHVTEVYRHYGEQPYFTLAQRAEAPKPVATRNADGTFATERIATETGPNKSSSRLGYVQKASKIMGTAVKNLQDEKLGKVENLMVDLAAGRIVAVVISSGGFLGMADELSAVPPTAFRFNSVRDTLQLDATKEALTSAPHFKANQWPDLGEPGYVKGVYQAYRVQPYFSATGGPEVDNTALNVRDRKFNATTGTEADNTELKVRDRKFDATAGTEADNTRLNVRDRNNSTLTPLNQGNSKADVATTAQIRKEIIAGKNMSVNARNVKIITIDGRITLRGPVKSAEEKRLIGEIAERSAHSGNVDNQLEVESPTNRN